MIKYDILFPQTSSQTCYFWKLTTFPKAARHINTYMQPMNADKWGEFLTNAYAPISLFLAAKGISILYHNRTAVKSRKCGGNVMDIGIEIFVVYNPKIISFSEIVAKPQIT